MPRPRHAQGRPGTRVIPADWETTHAPVVEKTFTAKCLITNPVSTPRIGDDLNYPDATEAEPTYDGGCRIQEMRGSASPSLGEQLLQRSTYLVVLARDAQGLQVGATIDVYESNDPDLPTLRLTVREPIDGSLRFERDLLCVADRS